MAISPQPTTPSDKEVHESLRTPEEITQRRRRRRWWVAGGVALLLALMIGFAAKPGLHGVKAWQARRLAAQARVLMAAGDWNGAKEKLTDANQLWREEPEVNEATASFLTAIGSYAEALPLWQQLEKARQLSASGQRDYGVTELGLGDFAAAEGRLRLAWPQEEEGTPEDWILGTEIAVRRNRLPEAIGLVKRLLASTKVVGRQRLNAARILLASGDLDDQKLGWEQIEAVAKPAKSPESLDALLLMAQRAARTAEPAADKSSRPLAAPDLTAGTLPALVARIETHPAAKVQHRLLAYDLHMALEPARKAEFIQAAIAKFGEGDTGDLAALGAWLYAKGELDKVLEVIPLSKAVLTRALFLQHLDALGALKRWGDVQDLIEAQRFSLEPVIQQMYLARCAEMLGQPEAREVHWKAAIAAAGTDATKLLTVGKYAQKGGSNDFAESAFVAAARADPRSREANESLVVLLESLGKTHELHKALQDMAVVWPHDLAVLNDVAYFDALLGENLPAARKMARDLVAADPGSMPHRATLALANLRLGDGFAALEAFGGVGALPMEAQPRYRAVYAAVLWKTSYAREATKMIAGVARSSLLPEEQELIRPIE